MEICKFEELFARLDDEKTNELLDYVLGIGIFLIIMQNCSLIQEK